MKKNILFFSLLVILSLNLFGQIQSEPGENYLNLFSKINVGGKLDLFLQFPRNRARFDYFGNYLIDGAEAVVLDKSITTFDNGALVNWSATGGFMGNFPTDYPYRVGWLQGLSYGVIAPFGDSANLTIAAGINMPVYFSPYVLDKKATYGGLVNIDAAKFRFRSFYSPRARMDNSTPLNGQFTPDYQNQSLFEEGKDMELIAIKGSLDYSALLPKTMRPVLSFIGASYFSVGYVTLKTHYEMLNQAGDEQAFVDNNYLDGEVYKGRDDIFMADSYFDFLNTKISYSFAREKYRNYMYGYYGSTSNLSYRTQDYKDYAHTLQIRNKGVPFTKKQLKRFNPTVNIDMWYIGEDYNAEGLVDDDDDNDGIIDNNDEDYIPGDAANQGWDEPDRFVMAAVLDKNENSIPDYAELHLLFDLDRDFTVNKLLYEDLNHNGVTVLLDNDKDPDFTYDKDRVGVKSVVGLSIVDGFDLDVGFEYNNKISSTNNVTDIFGSLSYIWSKSRVVNVKFETVFDKVKDNIADDYVNSEGALQADPLAFQDNLINKYRGTIDFLFAKNLKTSLKARYVNNRSFIDDSIFVEGNGILKSSYKVKFGSTSFVKKWKKKRSLRIPYWFMKRLVVEPQIKFEKIMKAYTIAPSVINGMDELNFQSLVTGVKGQFKLSRDAWFQTSYYRAYMRDLVDNANSHVRDNYVIELVATGANKGLDKNSRPFAASVYYTWDQLTYNELDGSTRKDKNITYGLRAWLTTW